MLQGYPEELLDYAVDDVIQAASVHKALDMHRLEEFARRRAARQLDHARLDADALRGQAAADGYRDGLITGLATLQPLLQALRGEQVALAQAVAGHIERALHDMAAAPDMVVEQVCAAFRARMAAAPGADRAVLHVPADDDRLLEALRAEPRLAGLELRASDRRLPLLEVGPMAWQLDIAGTLAEDVERALECEIPGVTSALDTLAARYSEQLLRQLGNAAQAHGFAQLRNDQ